MFLDEDRVNPHALTTAENKEFLFFCDVSQSNVTFPESTQALILEDEFVGLHGAVVASSHAIQVHLGLESNLDHIGGLCEGHCHGTCGASGQDTNQYTRV